MIAMRRAMGTSIDAKHYTRAPPRRAPRAPKAFFSPPFARAFAFLRPAVARARRFNVRRAAPIPKEKVMKLSWHRDLVGMQAPGESVTRDLLRFLVTAVVAGTGFALL